MSQPMLAFDTSLGLRQVEVTTDGHFIVAESPTVDPAVTVARAAISASSSGDNTVVAAQGAGLAIKVLGLVIVAAGDVDVRFESAAGGTALTGVISLPADGNGFVLPMSRLGYPWFQTADNALLNLELSGAVQVSGCIVYYVE